MISVVIPTLDASATLPATLRALIGASVDGIVRQVIVSDGGSRDPTLEIAEDAGADIVKGPAGRGQQLRAGAAAARFPWLLFLHADTVLEAGWADASAAYIDRVSRQGWPRRAAAYRFALDDHSVRARALETAVGLRSRYLKLPFGDQGLLIARSFYDELGGYAVLPIMEDVDLVRRIGRHRLDILPVRAVTDARRYREDGYARRVIRNQVCLAMHVMGRDPHSIARFYQGAPSKPLTREQRSVKSSG